MYSPCNALNMIHLNEFHGPFLVNNINLMFKVRENNITKCPNNLLPLDYNSNGVINDVVIGYVQNVTTPLGKGEAFQKGNL
jgi:hypothetical protein